ncbi:hypothetical protein UQW22_12660 [Isoptericola halotolerans]|uniref:hypothetical protein n=1 Tax=Isoptericola halotolerans TaxID=300560 RepID=UPI00388FA4CC
MHLEHLTEHRLREAELVRRVEQARQVRERHAALQAGPDPAVAPGPGAGRPDTGRPTTRRHRPALLRRRPA